MECRSEFTSLNGHGLKQWHILWRWNQYHRPGVLYLLTVFVTGDITSVFPGGGIGFIARGSVIVQQSLILYDDTHWVLERGSSQVNST